MEDTKSTELIVIIRPSFMKFCKDACRAALFNHALYWIARKTKNESPDKVMRGEVYWYATTEEITQALAYSWGEKKVRGEVNALVNMGLLGRTRNPEWGTDRTKFFFFGPEQCKKLLDLCEEYQIHIQQIGLSEDVLHLVNVLFANGKLTECKWTIYQMPRAQANGKLTGTITKDNTKVTNKGKDKLRSSSDSRAPRDSNQFSNQQKTVSEPQLPGLDVPSQQETDKPSKTGTQSSQAHKGAVETERLEKHRQIYDAIVKRRGFELQGKKIGYERKYINYLIEQGCNPDQAERYHRYLEEDDWRYNKPTTRTQITAKTIYDESKKIEAALADPAYQRMKQRNKNANRPRQLPSNIVPIASSHPNSGTNLKDLAAKSRQQRLVVTANKGAM